MAATGLEPRLGEPISTLQSLPRDVYRLLWSRLSPASRRAFRACCRWAREYANSTATVITAGPAAEELLPHAEPSGLGPLKCTGGWSSVQNVTLAAGPRVASPASLISALQAVCLPAQLCYLTLTHIEALDPSAVTALARGCPHLTSLRIYHHTPSSSKSIGTCRTAPATSSASTTGTTSAQGPDVAAAAPGGNIATGGVHGLGARLFGRPRTSLASSGTDATNSSWGWRLSGLTFAALANCRRLRELAVHDHVPPEVGWAEGALAAVTVTGRRCAQVAQHAPDLLCIANRPSNLCRP